MANLEGGNESGTMLLSVHQAAEELRVCDKTILNMINRGELKSVRIGNKRHRIPRTVLLQFIRKQLKG